MAYNESNENSASNAGKVMSARQAVSKIKDGSTVATGGFVGTGFPEQLAVELEALFVEEGRPAI